MLKAKSTCIVWLYCCTFGNSGNTISSGLQVIVIEVLCCLFVCGVFNDTVSSLNLTVDNRLWVFENTLLRKIFAAKREEVKGSLGKTA
jgi:hypothetical protein